jgi:ATP-dependent metalloprotease FtsH
MYALNQSALITYFKSMSALRKLDQIPVTTLLGSLVTSSRSPSYEDRGMRERREESSYDGGRFEGGREEPTKVVLTSQDGPILIKNQPERFAALFSFLRLVFAGGIIYLIYRQLKGGASGNDVFSMMKGTHQLATGVTETFSDVIGLDEAKKEVQVLVDYLKDPSRYVDFGVQMPKGLMMFGPPGVGKTLLARAMAGEAEVPFFYLSASQVDEVFVGLGASRIRDLFKDAEKSAPAIIFIDEIDAIGSKREFSGVGSGPSSRQSLTQMLTLMDGFDEDAGVLVIAATNAREQDLDSALLRSGRFDKKVFLHNPFRKDRKRLFEYYLGKMPHTKEFQKVADHMAGLTWGCSGADVANIVNQAGIIAVNRNGAYVELEDLQAAHADVLMGPENESMQTTAAEKKQTAAHEAGHCILALYTPSATAPRQVTIVPRKNALGYMSKDVADHVSQSREGYLAEIAVAMGGRAAEEVIYGRKNTTSGAESDFAAATNIAEAMVTSFGFSDLLGNVHLQMRKDKLSEETKSEIDGAIRSILKERYDFAIKTLKEKAYEHKLLTESLYKFETLTGEEIRKVVKGERLNKHI